MKGVLQGVGVALRAVAGGVFSFALWTLWLALVMLLAAQVYVASTSELAVPNLILRRIEDRLATSGIRVTFSGTSFDPTGRILFEDPRVFLPAFAEPVLSARAVYVRLNPWTLAAGGVEPSEIQFFDAVATVPAMLSASGRAEEIIHQLDATIVPTDDGLTLRQFGARIAGLTVSAYGTLPLHRPRDLEAVDVPAFLTRHYPDFSRRLADHTERLLPFEESALHLEFSPSASGAPVVQAVLLARRARLETPLAVEASNLRLATRILMFGDTPVSQLEFAAEELRLPNDAVAHRVQAHVAGRLHPGPDFQLEPREIYVAASSFAVAGLTAQSVSAILHPLGLARHDVAVVGRMLGEPIAVRAQTDVTTGSAQLRFAGSVSPDLLDPIGRRLGVEVRRFFDFTTLGFENGEARLDPGWKLAEFSARVAAQGIVARQVPIDEGAADVSFDGTHLRSRDTWARIGDNFARGTYEQELKTKEFRFLLEGRLRPLEISGWFREWWPNFFRQFAFPDTPPEASVEVSGIWGEPFRTAVFVFADAAQPVIRGAEFDQVRTRLFIRPGHFDGLEIDARSGAGAVRGTFTHAIDTATKTWRRLDLSLESTLDPGVATRMFGAAAERLLAPYQFTTAPALKLEGRFDGPASARGRHNALQLEARTVGEFRFHQFPIPNASFKVGLDGDEVAIDDFSAGFAGGAASGKARVWGVGPRRRVSFDLEVKDSSLGDTVGILQEFFAQRKGNPVPPPGKFVQERANVRFDLNASAEGPFDDPLAYRGEGSALLRGSEIGSVPLLGQLSELITFTSLRFREAQGNFRIEGPKLVFPEFALRGSNSAIDAQGEYALDRRTLDFKAKVFPFQESGDFLRTVVGTMLTPLSNALEVNLTGTLEKPKWVFVMGPSSFLRSLTGGTTEDSDAPATPPAAEPDAAPAPPAIVDPSITPPSPQ